MPKPTPLALNLEDLLAKAAPSDYPDAYTNHIQISISANEMFIDLYYVSPQAGKPPKVTHIHRAIAPVAMAKALATAISNVVANYEADRNLTLPNSREPDPEDKITIWP